MASAEFKRKGNFSEIVLPHLLAQALQSNFTGMFRAERESIIKVIYFREGEIAFASSNQPSDRLGEVLIKRGQLSREQLDMAMSKLEANVSLGKMLVELGYLSPKELLEGAKTQVEEILFSLNTWGDGTFEFIEGPLPQRIVDLKLNTRQVIFQGILQLEDRRWVLSEIGSMEAVYSPDANLTEVTQGLRLDSDVHQVIANINGTHTVRDLSSRSRLDDFTVGKVVAALKSLGLVEAVEHDAAASPGGEFLATREEEAEPGEDDTLISSESPVSEQSEPLAGSFDTAEQPAAADTGTGGLNFGDETLAESDTEAQQDTFVTDEGDVDEDEELLVEEPGGGRSRLLLPGVGVLALAVILGGVWFFFLRGGEEGEQPGTPSASPTVAQKTPPAVKTPPQGTAAATASPSAVATRAAGQVSPAATRTVPPRRTPPAVATATKAAALTPPKPSVTATPRVTSTPPKPTPRPTQVARRTPVPAATPAPRRTPIPRSTPAPSATGPGASSFSASPGASQARSALEAGQYRQAAEKYRSALPSTRAYSLQLEIICQESSIRTGMRESASNPDYFLLPFRFRGRSCYRAMWGVFPTKLAAKQAFSSVPAFFRQQTGGRAYVVPVGGSRR
jgi:hypothetical protein